MTRINVYGKEVEISRRENERCIYYVDNQEKKRKAEGIKLPSNAKKHEKVKKRIKAKTHNSVGIPTKTFAFF